MKIFLIGLMGSGKTTLGLGLAQKLQYQFIDTDNWIIELEKLEINQIFKTKGENYFRALEKKCLDNLPMQDCVIATGGGLPCYHNNMGIMNNLGLTIWLNPPLPTLVNRLWNNKIKRPLIANCIDENDLLAKLNYVYQKRQIFYQQASLTITNEDIDIKMLLNAIASLKSDKI